MAKTPHTNKGSKKRSNGKLANKTISKNKKNGKIDSNQIKTGNDLSETQSLAESVYEVEKITAHRLEKNKIKFLVKWDGYPDSENTWEEFQFFSTDAPQLVEDYIKNHIFYAGQDLNKLTSLQDQDNKDKPKDQNRIQNEQSDDQVDSQSDNLSNQPNIEQKEQQSINVQNRPSLPEQSHQVSSPEKSSDQQKVSEFERPMIITLQKDEDKELQNQSEVTLTEKTKIKILFQFEYGISQKKNGFLITIEHNDSGNAQSGQQEQLRQLVSEERLLKTHSRELYFFLKQKLSFESYPVSKSIMMSFSNETEIENFIGQSELESAAQSSAANVVTENKEAPVLPPITETSLKENTLQKADDKMDEE